MFKIRPNPSRRHSAPHRFRSPFVGRCETLEERRLLSAGAFDSTFGTGGLATAQVGTSSDSANGVAIQTDGKVVTAGGNIVNANENHFALARFTTGGVLDTSFGSGGIVSTSFGKNVYASASAEALQADGKIVAVGVASEGTPGVGVPEDFALARYNTNGTLDTSFGSKGKVTTHITNGNDPASAVEIYSASDPNGNTGKIVLAGSSLQGAIRDFTLVRYNTDGTFDTSFGNGGIVVTSIGTGPSSAYGEAIQPDGRIVVVGYARSGGPNEFALARYNANGSLDASFGSGGTVITGFAGLNDRANAVVLQGDGKIVAVGYATALDPSTGKDVESIALARYNTDGTLDATFGSGGLVTSDIFGGTNQVANAAVLDANGNIDVSGSYSNSGGSVFLVARYTSGGALDSSFGTGGVVTAAFTGSNPAAYGIAIYPPSDPINGGKIVAAGISGSISNGSLKIAVARFLG
ncbi:MAG TPA: delta-60 repeat domain-containing protein [Pirellulales bacterium]|jgi:uncharacterized delta-60 repeat protein|nr:delta-60 repeat domain-containing protein [Pirellulales bacterium]